MFAAQINNSSHICWEHDGLKFIAQMVIEHYKNILLKGLKTLKFQIQFYIFN